MISLFKGVDGKEEGLCGSVEPKSILFAYLSVSVDAGITR